VEAWTEEERKDIDHTFQEHKTQVKDAIKEIKKDLTCKAVSKYS
jgi:hypothetical protein